MFNKITVPTHDIEGHKIEKQLSQKEKDLKEIISSIDKVKIKAQKKLNEIQNEVSKIQAKKLGGGHVTVPTHDIKGHKMERQLSQKEKDLKEIISSIDKVRAETQKKLQEIQTEVSKIQTKQHLGGGYEEDSDEDYPDTYTIKVLNYNNKFTTVKEELTESLKENYPSNIMCIYSSNKPTTKLVVKLSYDIYVNIGSVRRILNEKNKIWYALPMFNGKKTHIGNVHGQNYEPTPEFIIYKLYTKKEIINRVKVVEDIYNDYTI